MSKGKEDILWEVPVSDACPLCDSLHVVMSCMRLNLETLLEERCSPYYICRSCGFEFTIFKSMYKGDGALK